MRELLNMFSMSESRDELGVGQIRDAISDLLFPGVSTLHTRARYLLVVPWCFEDAERRDLPGARFAGRVDRNERKVIAALKRDGFTDGLIGRRAGTGVKTLPSTIYWSALGVFGIRRREVPGGRAERRRSRLVPDELAERSLGMWHPTLPAAPSGFPATLDGGLDLAAEEAAWLRERMRSQVPDSLLAHVLASGRAPLPESPGPWDDPTAAGTTGELGEVVRDAECFSLAVHGAALLYNLRVAEEYEAAGFTKLVGHVELYREALADWEGDVAAHRGLARWDVARFWDRVIAANPRIASNLGARGFVNAWLAGAVGGSGAGMADRPDLRVLVTERERGIKRGQSRLTNEGLLRVWSGQSGSAPLTFRWSQARRILTDVHTGLARDEVADVGA